ncbi:MAG: RNA pseudouridine synthase [Erysipelotrichaceae bacterium]|nr:RNA pseudouridine synthase [Erysipelotrichaceae bacterium]
MIDIIYEDNHLLVVNKPINVPIVEDSSHDEDLLNSCKKYIKEKYHKTGNVYLGLVHRLDRPVGGICVFAKTSKAASRLSDAIRTHKISKQYLAIVIDENQSLKNQDHFEDYLLKDKKTNTTTVNKNGKLSILDYSLIERKDEFAKVLINLKTGRSHQIRVQFSSRNHPLFGDQRYNKNAKVGQQLALFSHSLSFTHPTTKELLTFKIEPNDIYPFNKFRR